MAKRFVRNLAEKIEEKVPSALEHLSRRILGDSERLAQVLTEHPEIEEILNSTPARRSAGPSPQPSSSKLSSPRC